MKNPIIFRASTNLLQERFESKDALVLFSALAQPSRLEVFRLLARYLPFGLAAGDIARLLVIPQNTLSTQLSILENAGLVVSRRQGRSIIYAANKAFAVQLAAFLLENCGEFAAETIGLVGQRQETKPFPTKREVYMAKKTYNVLVLCTGNSARSIMAEAILNREGAGRIKAFSAGSKPKGKPNPYAISLLKELGYDTELFRSKSWEEFSGPKAPKMDFILTVCDAAAGETCPFWPGHPLVAHWGISDPDSVKGTDAEKRAAFMEAYRCIAARITSFVNLDIEELDLSSLKEKLSAIGAMEGATEMALRGTAA